MMSTRTGPRPVAARAIAGHAPSEDEDRARLIYRMIADCQACSSPRSASRRRKSSAASASRQPTYAGKGVDRRRCASSTPQRPRRAGRRQRVDAREFPSAARDVARRRPRPLHRLLHRAARHDACIERREHKKNQFTQAYLGYGDDATRRCSSNWCFNWTREEPYTRGDTFGHIAIQVNGITALCDRLAAAGVPMPRPPRAQRHGENIVAFIEDPDGYRIELVQPPPSL